jgi:deoxyribose-phosphate aldolase
MIEYLDLTTLTGEESEADIVELCRKAQTPLGHVAAVCVYPQYVAVCARELEHSPVRIAAVANFPEGDVDAARAKRESAEATAAGAGEIDVVLPWRAWLDGDRESALVVVRAARAEAVRLKVILESGQLGDQTGEAARAALDEGADFIKTSTGKTQPGASPEAARAMLEVIRDVGTGGFKASGGVRTSEQAQEYLALAREILGDGWPTPATFRIGASGLLDVLLAEAEAEADGEGEAAR